MGQKLLARSENTAIGGNLETKGCFPTSILSTGTDSNNNTTTTIPIFGILYL